MVNATGGLIDLGTVDFLQDATKPIDELQARLDQLIEDDSVRDAFDVPLLEAQWQGAIDKISEYNEIASAAEPSDTALAPEGGEGGDTGGGGLALQAVKDEIEAFKELQLTKLELMDQEFLKNIAIVDATVEKEAEKNILLLELQNQYREQLAELSLTDEEIAQEAFDKELEDQRILLERKLINEETFLKKVIDLGKKYGKVDEKFTLDTNKKKEGSDADYANAAMATADVLFENNKLVKAGIIVADTAQNVVTSVANSGGIPLGIPAGIAAAAMGVAQLSALSSASKGGSSVSAPTASAPAQATQPSASGGVEVNQTVTQGDNTASTSNTVTVTAGDSDAVTEALAVIMKDLINSGQITPFPTG